MIRSINTNPEEMMAFNNSIVLYRYFSKHDWMEVSLGFINRYINANIKVCVEVDIERHRVTIGNTMDWKQEIVCDISRKIIDENYIDMTIKKYIRRRKLDKLGIE